MDSSYKLIRQIHRRPQPSWHMRPQQNTATSSKTHVDSVYRQESCDSVSSICHSLEPNRILNHDGVESKLAFTTEDLTNSFSSKPSSQFPSIHPLMKHPKYINGRFRNGIMSANNYVNTPKQQQPYRSRSTNSYPVLESEPPLRVRPTVTSILRQYHVLEKAEKDEKSKVDSLSILSTSAFEADNIAKRMEKLDAEKLKLKEAKRLQEARLAYERAKEASRKVADEKQRIAEETRQKEREWQVLMAEQAQTDIERRKTTTEELRKSFYDSKRAFDEMLQDKQEKANRMKMELEKLQQEAKKKEKEEKNKRLDKIKQIQAAKLALKRTKETIGNPNQFYRSIAIPETQIKLRLLKEEENRKLEEVRRKIQTEKQSKSVKLIKAMKKIQNNDSLSRQTSKVPEFLIGKVY